MNITILPLILVLSAGQVHAVSLYAEDGTYLGQMGGSPYDPESTSNPYGQYGSRYSPDSINNPYGQYGSQYSPDSPSNPYASPDRYDPDEDR